MKKIIIYSFFLFATQFAGAQTWNELGGLNALSPNSYVNTICSDPSGNIYAAGGFTNGTSPTTGKRYVAKWNGSIWSELGGLNALGANGDIHKICSDAAGNIYTAGSFTNGATSATGKYYVAKWNGTAWSELGGMNALAANSVILCLHIDATGNIYAGGYFISSATSRYYVAKWNGTAWSELGASAPKVLNSYVFTICSDAAGNIYAAGNFNNTLFKYYVAKWNGTDWSELGGFNALGANGVIRSISSDGSGNIYAAGTFYNSAGYQYVAKWNGTNWSELGGLSALKANSSIYSIYVNSSGNVFAGGDFRNSGFVRYVAKWDGTAWSEVGGLNALSANSVVVSLSSDPSGNLYATGSFTNSGGKAYVARFNNGAGSGFNETLLFKSKIFPNPAKNALQIESRQEIISVRIVDITGKTITQIRQVEKNSIPVNELSPGIYFLIMEDKNGNQFSKRFMKE